VGVDLSSIGLLCRAVALEASSVIELAGQLRWRRLIWVKRRWNALLSHTGYQYEDRAVEQALRAWGEENGFQVEP
jgi:hypothetical protein